VRTRSLVDAGPLVALIDRRDRYHSWAKTEVEKLDPPLYTCEAVLAEACFLLRHLPGASQAVMDLVQKNLVTIGLSIQEEAQTLQKLLMRYADVPISLADACMVRLAELSEESVVWTIDSDFRIYRSNGRSVIPLLIPEDR
jgi:predicted nucleic acid-binding protein